MAVLERYNSSVHDLYVYDQEANRSAGTTGNPIGYSSSCWAKHIDFTGVAIRVRHFNSLYPNFPNSLPDDYNADINNINFWNPGQYSMTLVSPRHAFICGHCYDHCIQFSVPPCWACTPYCNKAVWMNKEGVKYERTWSGPLLDPEDDAPWYVTNDSYWIELDEPIPSDSGIKIYDKFARFDDTQKYANCHNIDPNGKIYLRNFQSSIYASGSSVRALREVNADIDYHGNVLIHSGDSGSPTFIESEEHGTLMICNANGNPFEFGGTQWSDGEIAKLNTMLDSRPGGYSVSSIDIEDAVKYVKVGSGSSYSPSTYMNGKKLFCRVKAISRGSSNTDTEDSNYINAYIDGDGPTFASISLEPTITQDPTIPLSIFRGTSASVNVENLTPSWPPVSMVSTFAGDKNTKDSFSVTITGAARNDTIVTGIPIGLCGSTLTVDTTFINVLGAVYGTTAADLSDFGITGATVGVITFNPDPPEAGESLTITTAVTGNPAPRQTFSIVAATSGTSLVEIIPPSGYTFPINSELNIDIPVELRGSTLNFTWGAENGYSGYLSTRISKSII